MDGLESFIPNNARWYYIIYLVFLFTGGRGGKVISGSQDVPLNTKLFVKYEVEQHVQYDGSKFDKLNLPLS